MTGIRLRPARAGDRELVAGLLRGLSAESSYRRFQTGLGAEPGSAVLDALIPVAPRGGAVLAFDGDGVVGHGVWVRAGSTQTAEIGLVVADAHQARGIGTALAEAIIGDLVAHGIPQLEVFATATNEPVARMVARRAPDAVRELDGPTVTYRFAVALPGCAGARDRRPPVRRARPGRAARGRVRSSR